MPLQQFDCDSVTLIMFIHSFIHSWTTANDKAQNLTLYLECRAADVLKDVNELAPTAYEDIWTQLGRRFGYTTLMRLGAL